VKRKPGGREKKEKSGRKSAAWGRKEETEVKTKKPSGHTERPDGFQGIISVREFAAACPLRSANGKVMCRTLRWGSCPSIYEKGKSQEGKAR
jgi:hypothetical protein